MAIDDHKKIIHCIKCLAIQRYKDIESRSLRKKQISVLIIMKMLELLLILLNFELYTTRE